MRLPGYLWALIAVYFVASLAHFSHNAEYIAFYPGMPDSLTRETVYVAWLAVTSVGIGAIAALRLGFKSVGIALLAVYGTLGLDGLAHYTLALCSEHTLGANATIWSEAVAGISLALVSATRLAGGRK
jgi:hypothetical protein